VRSETYPVAIEEIEDDLEVIGCVSIDDLPNIRLVLDKVCKCVAFHHGRFDLGPGECGESGQSTVYRNIGWSHELHEGEYQDAVRGEKRLTVPSHSSIFFSSFKNVQAAF
jgi:hypothetical protein